MNVLVASGLSVGVLVFLSPTSVSVIRELHRHNNDIRLLHFNGSNPNHEDCHSEVKTAPKVRNRTNGLNHITRERLIRVAQS